MSLKLKRSSTKKNGTGVQFSCDECTGSLVSFSEHAKPAKSRTAIGNGSASVSRAASSHFTVNDLNRASSNKRCASFREGISYDSRELVAGSLSLFAFLSASNYKAKISENKFAFEIRINSLSRNFYSRCNHNSWSFTGARLIVK